MKRALLPVVLAGAALTTALSGCVVAPVGPPRAVAVVPGPVYVRPAPVYVGPPAYRYRYYGHRYYY